MQASYFVLIFVLCQQALSGSESPTWSGTSLIQAGAKNIVQNSANIRSDNTYVTTYAPAFSVTPFTALGVIGFETADLHEFLLRFKINIPNYTSSTSLNIYMEYPTDTAWVSFAVSYIAVDATFTALRVDYFSQLNPANVGSGVGLRIFTGIFNLNIGALDMTH